MNSTLTFLIADSIRFEAPPTIPRITASAKEGAKYNRRGSMTSSND